MKCIVPAIYLELMRKTFRIFCHRTEKRTWYLPDMKLLVIQLRRSVIVMMNSFRGFFTETFWTRCRYASSKVTSANASDVFGR
jgi:hypothetical protein